jgi:metal-responsive CopG/Arc/MetJ family transcriptional regulator
MEHAETKLTDDINITLPVQVIKDMDIHRGYKRRSEYIRDLIVADLKQPSLSL